MECLKLFQGRIHSAEVSGSHSPFYSSQQESWPTFWKQAHHRVVTDLIPFSFSNYLAFYCMQDKVLVAFTAMISLGGGGCLAACWILARTIPHSTCSTNASFSLHPRSHIVEWKWNKTGSRSVVVSFCLYLFGPQNQLSLTLRTVLKFS